MAFELPALPYARDALQPFMSAETFEYHLDKHHQAYVTNANKLIEGSGLEGKSVEEIITGSFGKNPGLFNNAAQCFNHSEFWKSMKPNGVSGARKTRPSATAATLDHSGRLATVVANSRSMVTMVSGFQARICSGEVVTRPLCGPSVTLIAPARSRISALMAPFAALSSPSGPRAR